MTITRYERAKAIIERFDGDATVAEDLERDRWLGVQTSDIGGVYFYTGETMREVADSLASDLDDGWVIGGCFDLDTGQNYGIKVEITCEVDAEIEGDVVLPEESTTVGDPNAALGHVVDVMGDLADFNADQINDAGRLAAKHAEVILREAMDEPTSPNKLLDLAAYCVDRALATGSASAQSLLLDPAESPWAEVAEEKGSSYVVLSLYSLAAALREADRIIR